jgi:hypothetical protein
MDNPEKLATLGTQDTEHHLKESKILRNKSIKIPLVFVQKVRFTLILYFCTSENTLSVEDKLI